ncbi:uncharacterized protein [Clytia hemisphaerica]|uniref:Apple domain-containing protein n=1 Tax=Clytia hemisphaerica TaxID=252671 RepID=A0A7M5WT87_9CNID
MMDWLRVATLWASIAYCHSQVIREDECQTFGVSFDWVVNGKLDRKIGMPNNHPLSIGQCTSRCVHFEEGDQGKTCKSINYNPDTQTCEILRDDLISALPDQIFDDVQRLNQNKQGWFHYSPRPDIKLVGPVCMNIGESGKNPCGTGQCIDNCEKYECKCPEGHGQTANGVCFDPNANTLGTCRLTSLINESSGENPVEIISVTSESAISFMGSTYSHNQDGQGCTFSDGAADFQYEPKTCTFTNDEGTKFKFNQSKCDHIQIKELVGVYDKGKIFKSQIGVEGGFKIKLNNLDMVLRGTISEVNFSDPENPTVVGTIFDNLLKVEAVSKCSITFKNMAKNKEMVWNKLNCDDNNGNGYFGYGS